MLDGVENVRNIYKREWLEIWLLLSILYATVCIDTGRSHESSSDQGKYY